MLRPLVSRMASGLCAVALITGTAPGAMAQRKSKPGKKAKPEAPAPTPTPAPPLEAPPVADAPPPTPVPHTPQTPPRQVTESDLAKAQQDTARPWAKGVSPDEQRTALAMFNEGNKLLRESVFPQAVDKYREALTHWDHPAIHYNLALALVNLDNPVEMHASLEKSMVYGAAPLGEDKFARAKDFKLLVEKQLAMVEYTLPVAGAKLIFDGKQVMIGPGTWTALVRAGEHSVAARADGYAPTQLNLKLTGGEPSRLELKLFTDSELTREKRKMPVWIPYGVLGAGVVIAGVGGLLHVSARTSFDDYDAAIAACAMTDSTGGCSMRTPEVVAMKSSAESNQTLAFATYTVGGLAIAAGLALVIINRPQAYRIDPFAEEAPTGAMSIAPVIGADHAGVAARGSF